MIPGTSSRPGSHLNTCAAIVAAAVILAAPAGAAPPHRPAAASSMSLPNAQWLAGSWIQTAQSSADCSSPFRSIRMDRSGALMSFIGIGRWSLTANRLHLVAQSPTQGSTDEVLTISGASANAFAMTDAAGEQMRLRRCNRQEMGSMAGLQITPSGDER